jgi:hypothetical protein
MPVRTAALRHAVTVTGAAIATTTAVVFVVVFLMDLFGLHTNPYFWKSKLSGTRQVFAVAFHTYSGSIPSGAKPEAGS